MSKIEYVKKSPIAGEIKVHVPADIVKEELERFFKSVQKDASSKGFRKGKVPMDIIRNNHMNEAIRNSFEKLVESSNQQAIQEYKIPVVQEPRVIKTNWLHWKIGNSMEYTATVELIPEPKLKKYKDLHFSISEFSVTDELINRTIQKLMEQNAELQPLKHPRGVRTGDQILIDFVEIVDGKEVAKSKTTNFIMEVGAFNSIKEIGDALLGEKVNAEKEVNITYPNNIPDNSRAGKTSSYKVKLKEIKQKIYPKLSDEIVKKWGENNVEDFKKNVRKRLEESTAEQKKSSIEEEALKTFLEENPMEIPPSLVNHQTRYILKEIQQNMEQKKYDEKMIEDYLKNNIQQITSQAEKEVRLAMLLPQVVKEAKLSTTDEEVDKHIEEVIRAGRTMQDFDENTSKQSKDIKDKEKRIQDYYKEEDHREELKNQIARGKAIDLIIEKAKITVKKESPSHGKG